MRCGTEDDRDLVAPAVRVAVSQALSIDQLAFGLEHFDDVIVCLQHELAGEQGRVGQEFTVTAHGVVDRQVVLQTHRIVLLTVAGGRVHGAGAGLQGDVIAEDDRHLAVIEGVSELQPLQVRAAAVGDHPVVVHIPAAHDILQHRLGYQQPLRTVFMHAVALHHGVFEFGVEGHRLVGRQGPRCGGPDHHRKRTFAVMVLHVMAAFDEQTLVHCLKAHIDGRRGLVLVLHLGLGQRRAAIGTPVHGLEALVQVAVLDDPPQGADDIRLEAVIHRQIGIIPVAEDAQALEVPALAIHLHRGIFTALAAKLVSLHRHPRLADGALHLQLDGQPVAVPARDIGRVVTGEGLGLDDNVLQDLVDRMADVDIPVCIGRAVVQDEFLPPGAGLSDLSVEVLALPGRQPVRLALGQIAAHGEIRFRKIQRFFVISHI